MHSTSFQLADGDRNVGTMYLPASPPVCGSVLIVCHGWQGDRTLTPFTTELVERLTAHGMAVVTFDFFGCGDTGGDYAEMTYGRWAEDIAAVFAEVASWDWVDATMIGCLGISSGSTAALRFARAERHVAFVISVASCLGLYINMPRSPARTMSESLEILLAGGSAKVFDTSFPLAFFSDFVEHAPLYELQAVACPVLFLQGTEDNIWRRTDALIGNTIRQKYNMPTALVEIAGGNHGLDSRPSESVDALLDWLQGRSVLEKTSRPQ
jgi:uncharacterized protein